MKRQQLIPRYDVTVLTFDNQTADMLERDYKGWVAHAPSPPLDAAAYASKTDMGASARRFGTGDWNAVTAQKLGGVLELLQSTGRPVLFIDLDIAIARPDVVDAVSSPRYTGLASNMEGGADFIFQVNIQNPPPCASEEDAEKRNTMRAADSDRTYAHINSGFYFLRASESGIQLIKKAIAECISGGKDDQEGYLAALRSFDRSKRLRYSQRCGKLIGSQSAALMVCTWHEVSFKATRVNMPSSSRPRARIVPLSTQPVN